MKLFYAIEDVISLTNQKFTIVGGGSPSIGKSFVSKHVDIIVQEIKKHLDDLKIDVKDVLEIKSLLKISNYAYGKNAEHHIVFNAFLKTKERKLRFKIVMLGEKIYISKMQIIVPEGKLAGTEVDELILDEFEYHEDDPTELKEC